MRSIYSSLLPQPLKTTDLFSVFIVLCVPECLGVGITQDVAFSDRLPSQSNTCLRLLHVFSWLDSSVLFHAESSIVWKDPN